MHYLEEHGHGSHTHVELSVLVPRVEIRNFSMICQCQESGGSPRSWGAKVHPILRPFFSVLLRDHAD